MKRIMMSLVAVSVLTGCSAMLVDHTNIKSGDGSKAYHLRSRYGGIDGDKDLASQTLTRYANKLCQSGYSQLSEHETPSLNSMGWSGYMTDLVWEIKCNKPEQPSS